jgi:ligand-binding sensor domain-containing protein
MRKLRHILFGPALAILAVVLMACHCGEIPVPVPPDPPDPPVEQPSESLKAFLQKTDIGLWIASEGIVSYDELSCQKAWSTDEAFFRIQKDDQSAFMVIRGSAQSTSSSYQVEYMSGNHSVTMMLLKLQTVQRKNSCVWLWNETMATGVIIPEGII